MQPRNTKVEKVTQPKFLKSERGNSPKKTSTVYLTRFFSNEGLMRQKKSV